MVKSYRTYYILGENKSSSFAVGCAADSLTTDANKRDFAEFLYDKVHYGLLHSFIVDLAMDLGSSVSSALLERKFWDVVERWKRPTAEDQLRERLKKLIGLQNSIAHLNESLRRYRFDCPEDIAPEPEVEAEEELRGLQQERDKLIEEIVKEAGSEL